MTGEIILDNHVVYDSGTWLGVMINGYISYSGPANFTLKNSILTAKSPAVYDRSMIRLKGISLCVPNDDI